MITGYVVRWNTGLPDLILDEEYNVSLVDDEKAKAFTNRAVAEAFARLLRSTPSVSDVKLYEITRRELTF